MLMLLGALGLGPSQFPPSSRCLLLLFQLIGCSDKQEYKGGAQEHLQNVTELIRRWRYRAIAVDTLSVFIFLLDETRVISKQFPKE